MTSKIRIKMGAIEVDYEGSEDFLKRELLTLIESVVNLQKEMRGSVAEPDLLSEGDVGGVAGGATLSGTTATIAAKLGGDSGGDLIMAGAAQLTFVERKDEFTTKELRVACRGAKNLWKKTYQNNFTNYLNVLVKEHALIEVRTGVYALHAKKKQALEAALVAG